MKEKISELFGNMLSKIHTITILYTIYTIAIGIAVIVLYDTLIAITFFFMSYLALWIFYILLVYYQDNQTKKDDKNGKNKLESN